MNETSLLDTAHPMTEGFFSGPYFGDEILSNSSITITSSSPVFVNEPEAPKHNLLLERPAYDKSPTNLHEDYKSSISLENDRREPAVMISPISSPITYNVETKIHLGDSNFSEQLPVEGALSPQSPNSRRIYFFEEVSDKIGNNMPTTRTSSPLTGPEPYPPGCGTVLDDTANVAPESIIRLPPTQYLFDGDDENTDSNSSSLEITPATEKSHLNSAHSSLLIGIDLLSSSPPTSSPPRIFSSSPLASSQASEVSDDSQGEGLEGVPKYIKPENFIKNISYNDRNSPSVVPGEVRHNSSPGSPLPDLGDTSHLPTPSCHYFPRTESLAHQSPSFLPKEFYDRMGDEVCLSVTSGVSFIHALHGQTSSATKHITLLQDPKLLPLTLPYLNVLSHDDTFSASLTLKKNIEERSTLTNFDISSQSPPTPSSLPSPSPLSSPLSSSPVLTETGFSQSTPYPANIRATANMNIVISDDERVFVPSPRRPDPSHSLLFTEIRENTTGGVALEKTKPPDTVDSGDFDMNLLQPTCDLNMTLGKRKRDKGEVVGSNDVDLTRQESITQVLPPLFAGEDPGLKAGETAKIQTETSLPNPKRSTIASQKLQHKKLTTPFRSPVIKRPKSEPLPYPAQPNHAGGGHSLTVGFKGPEMIVESEEVEVPHPPIVKKTDTKKKHRTQRAASQFKSPLSLDASSRAPSSLVRLTPTIQMLERKLQTLKRAIKVKNDGDEETLEALVKKWTEAGREVAWEIWELVKDNANSDGGNWGQPKRNTNKRPFEESWGWEEKRQLNNFIGEERERNWGWDVVPNRQNDDSEIGSDGKRLPKGHEEIERFQDADEGKKQDTLGTMLVQLGVAPDTLGWDEEEGIFVGE